MAYLARHNRPVHEVLMPRLHRLEATFANQFNGMTRNEVSLETLEQTRTRLVEDQPRWDCMPFSHLQELPAIRWKLQNLAKLKGAKRTEQVERLQACFEQAGSPA